MKPILLDPTLISQANALKDRRILLRGATILSMDPSVGELEHGDIFIEGRKIVAVADQLPDVVSNPDVLVLDVTGRIIIPGLQDVHRHCWQGQFRQFVSDAQTVDEYIGLFHYGLALAYRPEDIYAGTLATALGCIDCGITNVHDFMHNPRTPAHGDAGIKALLDAGIRGTHVQAGVISETDECSWPEDLSRIKSEYFSNGDNVLTLRLGAFGPGPFVPNRVALTAKNIGFARDLGIGLTADAIMGLDAAQRIVELGKQGVLGDDILFTHCLGLSDDAWQTIAEHGVAVALTPTSDSRFGMYESISPIQKVLDYSVNAAGIGADTEVNAPADLFTQMHSLLYMQRMLKYNRRYTEGLTDDHGLTGKGVLEIATIRGAKATGNGSVVGSITPGKEADLVMLNPNGFNNISWSNAYGTVVSGSDTRSVEAVMIAGSFKKWAGALLNFDLDAVTRKTNESRDYLCQKAGIQQSMFDMPKPVSQ